jgi:hypothetical protein
MEGIFSVKKRSLLASGAITWMGSDIVNTPLLPENVRISLVGILGLLTAVFFGGALWMYLHQQKIQGLTKRYSVRGHDFENHWYAERRVDWVHSHICVYKIWYSVSHDEIETVETGNTTTFTGDKVRVQDGIKTTEIAYHWIGINGQYSDSNVWKNVFSKIIKTRNGGRISILHIGYLKQVEV